VGAGTYGALSAYDVHLTVPEVKPRRLSSPCNTRDIRPVSNSPLLPLNGRPETGSHSSIHRSRSLNLCPALTDKEGASGAPSAGGAEPSLQRPGSATSSRTQSPAFLHIVELEVGRDGKFALTSSSSIGIADSKQPTPLRFTETAA